MSTPGKASGKSKADKGESSKRRLKQTRNTTKTQAKSPKKIAAAKGGKKKQSKSVENRAEKVAGKLKKRGLPANNKDKAVIGKSQRIEVPSPSPEMLRSFRNAAQKSKAEAAKREKQRKKGAGFLFKPPRAGKKYSLDLRVHSPGTIGYFDTTAVEPGLAMLRLAKAKGIDMIGITDYYNASYIDIAQASKGDLNLCVIPGIDLRCSLAGCDEVFATALFPEDTTSGDLEILLSKLEIPSMARGNRNFVVNKPFEAIVEVVESLSGVLVPSRLDKTPFRQTAIKPLVENFGFHAFDLVYPDQPDVFMNNWPRGEFTFFSFSNAHALAQIGSRTATLKLGKPGFVGLQERFRRRTS